MKPPKRARKPVERMVVSHRRTQRYHHRKDKEGRWTYTEKKKLVGAIQRYGTKDINTITTMVKSKSMDEIQQFLRTQKAHARLRLEHTKQVTRVPSAHIEKWLQLCEEVLGTEPDHSSVYARIFTELGKSQTADEPHTEQLSWERLNKFIECLLSESPTPDLTPIESTIMLEWVQALADNIKAADTASERRFIERQYRLLSSELCRRHGTAPRIVLSGDGFVVVASEDTEGARSSDVDTRELLSLNPLAVPADFSNVKREGASYTRRPSKTRKRHC
ncbi:PREDICTED: uncharacterized protein LOC106810533 [Priapulus caudatus]|uniref:Uncharacterized protein LOC106810533 n=1 Tax=Priapulus caudatus TaxID=37621 RepID=A0ABM1EB31_PRICU|nr:PREDICTED: uncharacterized protein LOC106810533 [Priapulus caudatus]